MKCGVTVGLIVGILAFTTGVSGTQQKNAKAPFAELEQHVSNQWGGWEGDKRQLAPLFNRERKRLGDSFRQELTKYLTDDIQKHYWCASLLTVDTYVGDNVPLPEFALLILHQGMTICDSRIDDLDVRATKVSMSVNAAVLSQRLGFAAQAEAHKATVTAMIEKEPTLRGAWPVLSSEDRKVFDSIPPKEVRRVTPTKE